MGNCVAGDGYLPFMSHTLLMTEGSGLYLAGPALVKAAIGQTVTHEELGGAAMHASVSGTIDYREKDEPSCIARLRRLVEALPEISHNPQTRSAREGKKEFPSLALRAGKGSEYDVRDLITALLDPGPFDEYKAEYGQTLICGYGTLGG